MPGIIPFLKDNPAFDPHDIRAMSMVLEDVCKVLNLAENTKGREIIAERIIELGRRGERSPTKLRDRLLIEVGGSGF